MRAELDAKKRREEEAFQKATAEQLGVGELKTCCVIRHASHVTRHSSHVTHHTSQVTRITSHVTGKKSVYRSGGKIIDVEAAREKAVADALAGVVLHVTRHMSHVIHHTSHPSSFTAERDAVLGNMVRDAAPNFTTGFVH